MQDTITTIASIATAISVIIATYQAYEIRKDNKQKNEIIEKENAFKMAELYANEILPLLAAISSFLKDIGHLKYADKIHNYDIKTFERQELQKYFSDKELIEIIRCLNKESNISYYVKYLSEGYKTFKFNYYAELIKLNDCNKNPIPIDVIKNISAKDLQNEVWHMMSQALNKLEYLCMYFNNNLAGNEYVYESLHQTFISYVENLYVVISYRNTDPAQKYFTEIIKLYNTWNQKENMIRKNIKK